MDLTDGFVIIPNIFTKEKLEMCREEILNFKKKGKQGIINSGGLSIPDFIKYEDLKQTISLKEDTKLLEYLDKIFQGKNYRFCSHNDIGINRTVGWHKDKLNGEYSKFQKTDIWSSLNGEKHEIVKVLIYLEDHSNDNNGLKVVPKSHLKREIKPSGWIQLKPKIGDVIIFDQRITHAGMSKQTKNSRILVSFGFGKNNIFTDEFELGTIKRQNNQNKK